MDSRITVLASNKENTNQNELQLASLNSIKRQTLLAILTSANDKEARLKAPVGKTRFYEIKRQVEPYLKELTAQIMEEAVQILKANTTRAAQELTMLLGSENPKARQAAAESVLDRTVGKPHIAIQQTTVSITPIQLIGVPQSSIDALFIPKNPIENQETKSDLISKT